MDAIFYITPSYREMQGGDMTDHDHNHGEETGDQKRSFEEKLEKLLTHWIHHNESHITSYLDWAKQVEQNQLPQIADEITKAAKESESVNNSLKKALNTLLERK